MHAIQDGQRINGQGSSIVVVVAPVAFLQRRHQVVKFGVQQRQAGSDQFGCFVFVGRHNSVDFF